MREPYYTPHVGALVRAGMVPRDARFLDWMLRNADRCLGLARGSSNRDPGDEHVDR